MRAYGTDAAGIIGEASSLDDMGACYGADLMQAEVDHLMQHEWARTAADVVWRRSKLGLRMTADEIAALDRAMDRAMAV